jgi:2-amino-4-hydroxy-6-hydroxymethyldihydropteridine diphosphokinase
MSIVYLGLGTNLGDRLSNLSNAIDALQPNCQIVAMSRIYETAPVGLTDQPSFLNMAVKAQTALPPLELLAVLKQLEKTLGRTEAVRWGPRLIDLDILLYDQLHLSHATLDIPHPRLIERRFALAPLADVGAEALHPTAGKTIAELLALLPPDEGVRVFAEHIGVKPSR